MVKNSLKPPCFRAKLNCDIDGTVLIAAMILFPCVPLPTDYKL